MNNRLIIQHLWWKELRQLVPMLVMLPTIAALLTILYLATTDRNQFNISVAAVVFLGMPGLFAVGAGALLVGQEKELRTILWLTSLPIRSQTIVRIKTTAAVLGLVILWVISGIYFLFRERFESPVAGIDQFWVWPANSLFILFAGLALAWKNKSALVALLLVVPIAIVPYVLAVIVHRIMGAEQSVTRDPAAATVITIQLVCSGIALAAADWLGCKALSPERIKTSGADRRERSAAMLHGKAIHARYGATQSPLPALIWQFAMQNRALLIGTSGMLAVASVLLYQDSSRPGDQSALAALLTYLGVSWLGASVFQSDSAHQRIRFLADRGISPKLVWLTRQAVPITIIVTISLGALMLAMLLEPLRLNRSPSLGAIAAFAFAMSFVIYSFSQWVGQVITSPIVSMITAPLLSLIPFGAYSIAVGTFGAPLFLVVVAAFLPFIVTYVSTRRWMDRRFGTRYWCMQACYAAVIFLMPAIPHIAALVLEPGMQRQVRAQMNAVSLSSQSYFHVPVELVLNKEVDEGKPFESFVQTWNDQLDSIELQLGSTSRSVGISSTQSIIKLLKISLMSNMSLTQGDIAELDEQRKLYRRSMSMLSDIVVRMRMSPRIIDQDQADLIEIAILKLMTDSQASTLLGEDRYRIIASRLADKPGRRQARIRAVALSWFEFEQRARLSGFPVTELGGYGFQEESGRGGLAGGKTLMNRRASRRAENLWRLANFSGRDVPHEILAAVANDWGKPLAEYGLGPNGNFHRIDDANLNFRNMLTSPFAIASQWHGGWEDQARRLVIE